MKKIVSILLALTMVTSIFAFNGVSLVSAATDYSAKAYASSFKLNGRARVDGEGIQMDFSGDGVEWTANCSGDVYLTFKCKYQNNFFAVWIDGKRVGGDVQKSGQQSVSGYDDLKSGRLQPMGADNKNFKEVNPVKINASSLASGMHTFKIVKIAQVIPDNILTLTKVSMNGSFGTKPANKSKYIEFIGDSITAGLGILTHNPYDMLGSDQTDPTLAYAWQIADAFDADRSLVCAGGIGIGSGAVANSNKANNPWRQCDMYPYHCAYRNWSTSDMFQPTRVPNLVVINLGTNDWMQLKNLNYSGQKGRPTIYSYVDVNGNLHEGLTPQESMNGCVETIIDCYAKLLTQVRKNYGNNVPILCCVGMMNYGTFPNTVTSKLNKANLNIKELYERALSQSGVGNTYFQWLNYSRNTQDVGGADHPFYSSHTYNAQNILIPLIQKNGWMGGVSPTITTTQTQPQPTQSQATTQPQPTQTQTQPAPVTGDTFMPADKWESAWGSGSITKNGGYVTGNWTESSAEYAMYDYNYHKNVNLPADTKALKFTVVINSIGNQNVPLEIYMGGNNTALGKYSGTFIDIGKGSEVVGKSLTFTYNLSDFAGGAGGAEKRAVTVDQLKAFEPLEFRVRADDQTTNLGGINYSVSDIVAVSESGSTTTTKATTTTTTTTTTKATTTTTTTTTGTQPIKKGDVNGDGEVNVADVQALLVLVQKGQKGDTRVTDMNNDGNVDIIDVNLLLNMVLKG